MEYREGHFIISGRPNAIQSVASLINDTLLEKYRRKSNCGQSFMHTTNIFAIKLIFLFVSLWVAIRHIDCRAMNFTWCWLSLLLLHFIRLASMATFALSVNFPQWLESEEPCNLCERCADVGLGFRHFPFLSTFLRYISIDYWFDTTVSFAIACSSSRFRINPKSILCCAH